MIESLSSRIHFAFGPDLSYHADFPVMTDKAFLREHVSGGKTLAAFRVALPPSGIPDDLPEYATQLHRYFSDGTLDKTFGRNGTLDVGTTSAVRVVAGSRILVVPEGAAAIRSYSLNGRVDTTLGGDGTVGIPLGRAVKNNVVYEDSDIVSILPNGQILTRSEVDIVNTGSGGSTTIDHLYAISRLNTDGSVDTTFGKKGYLTFYKDGTVSTFLTSRALYILVNFGYGTTPASGQIVKISTDGKTADTNFDGDGVLAIKPFPAGFTEQPDGKLLYIDTTYGQDPVLYRLNTDGTPDTSFSGDGNVPLTYADSGGPNPGSDFGYSVKLDSQNRIYVSARATIFRFDANGTLAGYPFNGTAPFKTAIASVDDAGNVYGTDQQLYHVTNPQQLDAKGIVQIVTDSGDDTVSVSDAGNGKIRVIVNGISQMFRASGVKGLNLQLYDGDINLRVALPLGVTLAGGNGNDTIVTAGGNDKIVVGNGNHTVDLGRGNDTLEIGDLLHPNTTDRQTIVGSGGNKTIEVKTGSANIDLAAGDSDVWTIWGSQNNRIRIAGGNNTVRLDGHDGDAVTIGGSGKNDVTAFGPHDSVTTGDGPDTVLAISSAGLFNTGGGNDVVTVRNFSNSPTTGSTIYAGAGDDHVFCDRGYNSLATIYGGAGNDLLEGWTLSQRVNGDAGNDTIYGYDGNDYLYGGDGDDLIVGGASSDRLYGDAGYDRLYGQSGNDTLSGGADNDRLYAQTGNDVLNGDDGNDRLYADDNAGHFVFHGGPGDDLFFTRNNSVDTLFGDGGKDFAEADPDDVLSAVTRA